jgi:hypothetical protein
MVDPFILAPWQREGNFLVVLGIMRVAGQGVGCRQGVLGRSWD